ncbi:MAG: hypothetical protein RPV21_08840 [Candidatus Sedimenticola sp. (ex Thyasira tokunagai)]
MVKKHLAIGKTSQGDVLKLFGSPNNMTLDSSGKELWIYDKVKSTISSSGEQNSTGGFIGGGSSSNGSGLAAGYGTSSSSSSAQVTSTIDTLTVIMEFDSTHTLTDFSVRQGRY